MTEHVQKEEQDFFATKMTTIASVPKDYKKKKKKKDENSILIGYAFGPKKLSTMGLVLAEASQSPFFTTTTTKSSSATITSPSVPVQETANNNNSNATCFSCSSSTTSTSTTAAPTVSASTMTTAPFPLSFSTSTPVSTNPSSQQQQQQICVSFVPVDLNEPLEEQHGGQFDIILHKLTEDILQSMTIARTDDDNDNENHHSASPRTDFLQATSSSSSLFSDTTTRKSAFSARRMQRLISYAQSHQNSCFVVDHPLAVSKVLDRYTIATTLASCLRHVTSSSGFRVATPPFCRVPNDYDNMASCSLQYPMIAKPLIAAGTKSSHCMRILVQPPTANQNKSFSMMQTQQQQQQQPAGIFLQEYANHDQVLWKVYVLGGNSALTSNATECRHRDDNDHHDNDEEDESIFVFERPSLPNLPRYNKSDNETSCTCPYHGDDGNHYDPSRLKSFVDFDSQVRPYPTIHDFYHQESSSSLDSDLPYHDKHKGQPQQEEVAQKSDSFVGDATTSTGSSRSVPSESDENDDSTTTRCHCCSCCPSGKKKKKKKISLTRQEVRPIVNALRQAFGLELFGFDILLQQHYDGNDDDECPPEQVTLWVVDVNYFPSYKEVTDFPSLLNKCLVRRALSLRQQE